MIRFGKYPDRTIAELAGPAVLQALAEAGATPRDINAAYTGSMYGGTSVGQRILKTLDLTGIPIVNVENACSSSSTALREAWIAVGAGIYDTAMVIGVDQLSVLPRGPLPLARDDLEVRQGMIMPALYAMRARRHMQEYGTTIGQLARVSVKNHHNGALNPHAQYQMEVSLDEVAASRPVADPLTLLHSCPTGDGAAAVIIAASKVAKRFTRKPAKIVASVLTSGRFMAHDRDMTSPEVSVRAAAEAYEMAGLGPADISVAEVHDAFTIAEIMYYEALGFCGRGEGGRFVDSGATELGGQIPVNPSGGLLAKGHPPGATGVAQVAEVWWELQGAAGPRQVENAKVGLTHCTGGGVSGLDHAACTIHILAV